jgi:alkylated DNA repair dioxygenase AlkB
VATLSLGATPRLTLLLRRPAEGARRSLELPSGSLLVMRGRVSDACATASRASRA